MHTDLQWPSPVLHSIITAAPGTETMARAPLLSPHWKRAHVQSEGSCRKAKRYRRHSLIDASAASASSVSLAEAAGCAAGLGEEDTLPMQ